jgi:choline dehydrogenase-like flavoprotein
MASRAKVLCSVEEFVSEPFDFIVVGGGTAGLLLANRLSENGKNSVGVLEAGGNKTEDPNVNIPVMFPRMLGSEEYDWMLKSVPQVSCRNNSSPEGLAKTLIGTIEQQVYCAASREDAWRFKRIELHAVL